MLNPQAKMKVVAGRTTGERTPARKFYAHLLEGSGLQLEPASCLYFDGISRALPLSRAFERIEKLFAAEGQRPSVVLVGTRGQEKSKSKSMKWLYERIAENGDAFLDKVDDLQFFPKGRSTNEATWEPSIYFSIWLHVRQGTAAFSVNKWLDLESLEPLLVELADLFEACAAYGLYFPKRFSPSAYFYGISAPPSYRGEGTYSRRDSERLVHWRDNSQIGIESGGVRRFYNACDGYVRDAYPLMLLSAKHMARRVGKLTLADAVGQHGLGTVKPEGDKFFWRIPAEKLAEAQQLLDDNDISLSGRRLE